VSEGRFFTVTILPFTETLNSFGSAGVTGVGMSF
jgi:hypothetical protein